MAADEAGSGGAPGATGLPPWVLPTLVGCLLVIVGFAVISFIGIIAAVAIPQFAAAKERPYDRAAQAELQRVRTAQEAFRMENGLYAWNLYDLDFEDDPEVTTVVLFATSDSYSLCSKHSRSRSSWWADRPNGEIERRWHVAC